MLNSLVEFTEIPESHYGNTKTIDCITSSVRVAVTRAFNNLVVYPLSESKEKEKESSWITSREDWTR